MKAESYKDGCEFEVVMSGNRKYLKTNLLCNRTGQEFGKQFVLACGYHTDMLKRI